MAFERDKNPGSRVFEHRTVQRSPTLFSNGTRCRSEWLTAISRTRTIVTRAKRLTVAVPFKSNWSFPFVLVEPCVVSRFPFYEHAGKISVEFPALRVRGARSRNSCSIDVSNGVELWMVGRVPVYGYLSCVKSKLWSNSRSWSYNEAGNILARRYRGAEIRV